MLCRWIFTLENTKLPRSRPLQQVTATSFSVCAWPYGRTVVKMCHLSWTVLTYKSYVLKWNWIMAWRHITTGKRFSFLTSSLRRLSTLSDDQCSSLLSRFSSSSWPTKPASYIAQRSHGVGEVSLKASAVCKTDVAVCKALADQMPS